MGNFSLARSALGGNCNPLKLHTPCRSLNVEIATAWKLLHSRDFGNVEIANTLKLQNIFSPARSARRLKLQNVEIASKLQISENAIFTKMTKRGNCKGGNCSISPVPYITAN